MKKPCTTCPGTVCAADVRQRMARCYRCRKGIASSTSSDRPCVTCGAMLTVSQAKSYANCRKCRRANPTLRQELSKTRCATCENFLTVYDANDGSRRCKPCRKKSPGRWAGNLNPPKPKASQHIVVSPSKEKIAKAATVSWWLEVPSVDGFTARASQEIPRMSGTRTRYASLGEEAEMKRREEAA